MSDFHAGSKVPFQSVAETVAEAIPVEWSSRLKIEYLEQLNNPSKEEDGADVVQGLSRSPKTVPPKYFYDDRGSQLFEKICDLPEYYLTRTETAILQHYAGAIAQHTGACELVELGSGSSTKTRILLEAYQAQNYPLCYRPIDVSGGILQSSAQRLLQTYEQLKIHALVGTYDQALQTLSAAYLPQRMICFLGSSLGNLSPEECDRFFDQVRLALRSGGYFLLGVDLHKSTAQLEAAYNDKQGITAAFNLNLLQHLNQRFNGNFDLAQFEHFAFYNTKLQQIEMHLRSLNSQTIDLKTLNLTAGETIRSEISRKFDVATLRSQLQAKGLQTLQIWQDTHQWFGLLLCQCGELGVAESIYEAQILPSP
jgi:L-histidine Nalpha-methyltransferase